MSKWDDLIEADRDHRERVRNASGPNAKYQAEIVNWLRSGSDVTSSGWFPSQRIAKDIVALKRRFNSLPGKLLSVESVSYPHNTVVRKRTVDVVSYNVFCHYRISSRYISYVVNFLYPTGKALTELARNLVELDPHSKEFLISRLLMQGVLEPVNFARWTTYLNPDFSNMDRHAEDRRPEVSKGAKQITKTLKRVFGDRLVRDVEKL